MYVTVLARRIGPTRPTEQQRIVVADDENGASDRFRWAIMAKETKETLGYSLEINALKIMLMMFVFMTRPTALLPQQKRIFYN